MSKKAKIVQNLPSSLPSKAVNVVQFISQDSSYVILQKSHNYYKILFFFYKKYTQIGKNVDIFCNANG